MSQGLEKLADEVLSRWESISRWVEIPTPPSPDRAKLIDFFDVAFLASLTYDERRPTIFRLILCPQNELEKIFAHRRGSEYTPIKFSNPLPFEPAQVRRLAPATDPSRVLIGIETALDDSSSPFRIWGLLDTGSSWSGFLQHERGGGMPPPDLIAVTSTEPGHLLVTRGGHTIAVLRSGSITYPRSNVLYGGPIGRFFSNAQAALYQELCGRLEVDRYSDSDDGYPGRAYTAIVERLLYRISSQHHGGTLLLIPDIWHTEINIWSPVVSIKYPIEDYRLWNLLLSKLELHKKYYSLYFGLRNAKRISKRDYYDYSRYEHLRDVADEQMRDSIAFAGSLSGVDGAIIMTDKFRILGFGAEVTAPAPVLHSIHLAEDTSGEDFQIISVNSYGTRHRAAFRYCWSLPQAIAFVISQDGGVRVVRRVGDDVIMWAEILAGALAV
jgi:Probable sensor domain DACNV